MAKFGYYPVFLSPDSFLYFPTSKKADYKIKKDFGFRLWVRYDTRIKKNYEEFCPVY